MSSLAPTNTRLISRRLAAALISMLAAAPVEVSAAQPLADVMARQVAALARKPVNVPLLIAAGRTALQLGDAHAAAGFFGRARELAPGDAAAHLGMGSTLVALNRPEAAFVEFARAQELGAAPSAIAPDLGLAYDLAGDQLKAQAVYRSALGGRNGAEARQRLALSLAISGDCAAATTMLQPLLAAEDNSALRTRAFILALNGDVAASTAALNEISRGRGSAAEPFLRALPALSAAEKAAALNLGIFPSRISVAASDEIAHDSASGDRGVKPMQYGGTAAPRQTAPSGPEERKKAQLALFGVFPEP